MGIGGITYTDGRGRRRDIAAMNLEEFKRQMDGQTARAGRARVMPQLPQILGSQQRVQQPPDTMPGASVVNTRNGLALKGEENDPTVAGKKVYGSVDGVKGWHSLDEIDPDAGGRRVGAPVGCNEENEIADAVDGFDGKAFRSPSLSRIHMRKDATTGQLTLFEYQKEIVASRGRRIYGVTGETMRVVGSWFPGGSDARDYPYAVKEMGSAGDVKLYGIYLPPNTLYVAGEEPDITTALNAVEGRTWWYELPNGHQNGPVYIHVTLPHEDESGDGNDEWGTGGERLNASAEITTSAETPGEHDFYIEIANVVDGDVYQKVVGTLVFSDSEESVTSLNDLVGDIELKAGDGVDVGNGKTIYPKVETDDEENVITINLTDEPPSEDGGEEGGYCNDISDDSGEGGGGGGNSISDISSDGAEGGNGISRDPCNTGEYSGDTGGETSGS